MDAGLARVAARIAEGAEKHIEKRKVRVVVQVASSDSRNPATAPPSTSIPVRPNGWHLDRKPSQTRGR